MKRVFRVNGWYVVAVVRIWVILITPIAGGVCAAMGFSASSAATNTRRIAAEYLGKERGKKNE